MITGDKKLTPKKELINALTSVIVKKMLRRKSKLLLYPKQVRKV